MQASDNTDKCKGNGLVYSISGGADEGKSPASILKQGYCRGPTFRLISMRLEMPMPTTAMRCSVRFRFFTITTVECSRYCGRSGGRYASGALGLSCQQNGKHGGRRDWHLHHHRCRPFGWRCWIALRRQYPELPTERRDFGKRYGAVARQSGLCQRDDHGAVFRPGAIVGNCSFTVLVKDNEKPAINCPGRSDGVSGWQLQRYDRRSYIQKSDNCSGTVSEMQSPAAGTALNGHKNAKTVTLTATDVGNSTTCSFELHAQGCDKTSDQLPGRC